MNKVIQILCASALFFSLSAIAKVESLSPEVFKDGDNRSWEVSVQCAGAAESKIISKPISGGAWCANNNKTLCDGSKETLAAQLCGVEVSSVQSNQAAEPAVAAPEATAQTAQDKPVGIPANVSDPALLSMSRNELMQEQMRIEEMRIQIQQRHVELRKREIELQKRLLGNT